MPLPEHLIAEFERIRKNLIKEIEIMAAGRMTTGEKSEPGPWLPTLNDRSKKQRNRSRKWSASCETRRSTSPPMSDRSLPALFSLFFRW